jgi:signal transduction histidine kinase
VITTLYHIPVGAWGYAALLCGFVGLIALLSGFYSFSKRYRQLIKIKASIGIEMNQLPKPRNGIEECYHLLLEVLFLEKKALVTQMDQERKNTQEYYTVWVHQIKTPIAAMRLLLQKREDEQSTAIRTELFEIEQYVEMVLTYLRMQSASTDYIIGEFNLDIMIRQAVRKYAPLFIRKKLKLNFQETNTKVLTDKKWLLFVIEQILSNALKYTQEGEITIKMVGDQKTLAISDTGIGIAREDLPRIFEQGFTGYNGRWQEGKSTGIGLYLSRQILKKLSHKITIHSESGKGTIVYIQLDNWKSFL